MPQQQSRARKASDHPASLPVHKYTSTSLQPALNELITSRKMFEQILIIDIVDLHDHVIKPLEQPLVQWQSQHRQDMRDAGCLQGFFTAQCE